jgi:hypothetical protein
MGVRYPNARRIKIHRNYTVEEIARILDLHKHTVRRWERAGLQAIDDDRPKLFRGPEVRRFLGEQRQKARHPSASGQMYCFKCRGPRAPFGRVVDLLPVTTSIANLRGLCECGTLMHRRVSHRTFHAAARGLMATIPQALSRIGEKQSPSLNADLVKTWRLYAKSQCEE